jgi:hypothetical protein
MFNGVTDLSTFHRIIAARAETIMNVQASICGRERLILFRESMRAPHGDPVIPCPFNMAKATIKSKIAPHAWAGLVDFSPITAMAIKITKDPKRW